MKISILPTVPIGLMQKKSPATSRKARNRRTQQVRRLYFTKKNLRTWLFRNSLITVRNIQLQNVSIPQKMEMPQLNKKGQ